MPRQMTTSEKQSYSAIFPRLDVNRAIVAGEPTPVYNCISWTVGVTTTWLWPGPTLAEFDAFYARYGFFRSTSGHIAAWGAGTNAMTHGSVVAPAPLSLWESKCGAGLRIQHGMNELESAGYGRILVFYGRGRFAAAAETELMAANNAARRLKLTKSERERLEFLAGDIDPDLQHVFGQLFSSWRAEWRLPHIAFSSDPGARRLAPSFYPLLALGPDILPLVVQELADPENFFALQLYDYLQGDPTLRIQFEPDSVDMLEGEQGRALRTVRRYLSAV